MAGAQGEERSAALTFANTLRVGPSGPDDDLSDNAKASIWLRQHDYKPGLLFGTSDLKRLVELRSAIQELLTARADKKVAGRQAVDRVNREAAADPVAPKLTWKRTVPTQEPVRNSGTNAIAAALARDAIDVVTGELGGLLHPCGAEDCTQFYVRDHGRRQWCSTTCGDRVRQRRRTHS